MIVNKEDKKRKMFCLGSGNNQGLVKRVLEGVGLVESITYSQVDFIWEQLSNQFRFDKVLHSLYEKTINLLQPPLIPQITHDKIKTIPKYEVLLLIQASILILNRSAHLLI